MWQWLVCPINEDVFTFPCVHYFDKLSEMNLFFVGGLILVRDPRTIHNAAWNRCTRHIFMDPCFSGGRKRTLSGWNVAFSRRKKRSLILKHILPIFSFWMEQTFNLMRFSFYLITQHQRRDRILMILHILLQERGSHF